jgi:hypothetical protein
MDKSGYWVLAWELGVDSVKQNLLSLKSQILPLTNSANTPLASFSFSFSPPSLSPFLSVSPNTPYHLLGYFSSSVHHHSSSHENWLNFLLGNTEDDFFQKCAL